MRRAVLSIWNSLTRRQIFGFFFLLFGMVCFRHYWNQRELWGDEQIVLNSLKAFSFSEMMYKPLLHTQAFPRMWGILVKAIAQPWDFHVLSLRLVSFIAELSAFALWGWIVKDAVRSKADYALFLLSWCASIMMVYYAAELKPYAVDTLVAAVYVAVILQTMRNRFSPAVHWVLITTVPFLCLLSFIAVVFWPLWIIAYCVRGKSGVSWSVLGLLVSMAAAAFAFYRIDYVHLNHGALQKATLIKDYFIYTDSFEHFFKTVSEGLNNLFSRWFGDHPRYIRKIARMFVFFGLIYMVVDGVRSCKRVFCKDLRLSVIALVVLFELMILSTLKMYPFVIPRTVLFFAPLILFSIIEGMNLVVGRFPKVLVVLKSAYAVFLIFTCVGLALTVFSGDLGSQSYIW